MEEFQLVLKNEKLRLYTRLCWFIIIILTLVFVYYIFFTNSSLRRTEKVVFLGVLGIVFLLKLYFEKTKYRFGIEEFYPFLAMGFFVNSQYLIGGVAFLFYILYKASIRQKVVHFFTDKILYPSFPVKTIQWENLNNCLLKDGLLTIDFKTNKLIQQPLDYNKTSVNEKEFNDFCRQQLATNNK
jgi:hypothetical protein